MARCNGDGESTSREDQLPTDSFDPPATSVLNHFSDEAGEAVAFLLIRELVETVDRPANQRNGATNRMSFKSDNEIQWLMQIVNHAFSLPMHTTRDCETVRAAVRLYLAWITAINIEPHVSCPQPLRDSPLHYFRQILDSFRSLFLPRASHINDVMVGRQATEIHSVLATIRLLYSRKSAIREECRREMWTRVLTFIMVVNDGLLKRPTYPDELASVMAADLGDVLFDAWTQASMLGQIPSMDYWKRLNCLARNWITYVSFVESWARKLLSLTVIFTQKIYGSDYCTISIHDDKLLHVAKQALSKTDLTGRLLSDTWHQLVNLIGNPASFIERAEQLCEDFGLDQQQQNYVLGQASISFFLAVTAFAKMVDIFFGDPLVSIDFHEAEELHAQWMDANRSIAYHQDDSMPQRGFSHRPSNLSTSSSTHSTAAQSTHSTSGYSTTTNGQQSIYGAHPSQSEFNLSSSTNGTGGTLTHQSLAYAQNHAQAVAMGSVSGSAVPRRPTVNGSKSASSRLSSRSIHAVSLQTDSFPSDTPAETPTNSNGIRPGQYVWYTLKANKMHNISTRNSRRPPSDALLEMFLPILYNSAMIPLAPEHRKYSEDVISQRSFSSAEIEQQTSGMSAADVSAVNRRSFANSTASSTDFPSPVSTMTSSQHQMPPPLSHAQLTEPDGLPSVDGRAAGRSQALAALCRIVCAKSTTERLGDEQLAQFLTVLHDALVERDRLMLCAVIFYTTDLFKLGLPGVEVLLPNYAMAIDLVLTESFKLRLHPSISEIDMRHACLRAMSAIISWPTTFGTERIVPPTHNSQSSRLLNGGQNNLLTTGCRYIDIRSRMIKNLVYTLRTETDSMNLQLALGLCHTFCEESTRYDLNHFGSPNSPVQSARNNGNQSTKSAKQQEEEQVFVVSALKRLVSAICDNLCKPAWSSELATLLATFDCLNAMAALPKSILFHRMELSCGSLTVSSLCRFINSQLQKPPMHHSRDLHSTVVAAFQCLEVWFCAAPMLSEMDSCIGTVAHTIEFGMTGGNGLSPEHYKPASQRVYDAAESLQFTLFASVGSSLDGWAVVDEQSVIRKLGDDNLSLDRFQHFVVDKSTILSLHDITHVDFVSKGLPTLVMVARSPYRAAHASLIQLRPRPFGHELNGNKENSSPKSVRSSSMGISSSTINSSVSSTSTLTMSGSEKRGSAVDNQNTITAQSKQFEFPSGIHEPECQLDAQMKPPAVTPDTKRVEDQIQSIRSRLAAGAGCAIGDRDSHNVWISSQLGALLCQPPVPDECVRHCNSIRVFLYDMGVISRSMFGNELIALDTTSCLVDYHAHLHQLVDRQPAKRCETVSIFYVRADQSTPTEILQNAEDLRSTDSEFCTFVAQLGRARSVREPGFWTGHWQTAFAVTPPASQFDEMDHSMSGHSDKSTLHRLDGVDDCLWWTDAQLEVAYQLPTERSMQRNLGWSNAVEQRHDDLIIQQQKTVPRRFYYCRSFERSDSEDSNATFDPSDYAPTASPSHQRIHEQLDEISSTDFASNSLSFSSSATATVSCFQRRTNRPLLSALSVDVGEHRLVPRNSRFASAAARVIAERRRGNIPLSPREHLNQEVIGEEEVKTENSPDAEPFERRRRATVNSGTTNMKREFKRQKSVTSTESESQQTTTNTTNESTHRFSVYPASISSASPSPTTSVSTVQTPPTERPWTPLLRKFSIATTSPADSSPQTCPSTPNAVDKVDNPQLSIQSTVSPTANSNWTNLRSWWFKRKESTVSPLTLDSCATLPPIPEPISTVRSAGSLTLETMSEADLQNLFPRMAVVAAAAMARKTELAEDDQGYTPSSTASSLAPTSRTTSSLTNDSTAKRNSDISASSAIPPTPHPGSIAAQRTRSTSTINSDCSTRIVAPTAHAGDRQQSWSAQSVKRSHDQRIVVVWLERFEDYQNFPYEQLLPATDDGARRLHGKPQRADVHLIFIHNFESGLARLHVESVWTKAGQPGPLVDGLVVSTLVLPGLLRQTIANIARRKAVEVDQPTSSYRRRQAIGELSRKFATPLGYTEFLDRFVDV
ncbi:Ral GTPase-activating protein subunit beta [Aphelenchoides besseyi]|nr:Ral GTPase-activating protein subunit beta [Aphelenchoides besseyi]KAI6211447.1 Ral GTPase-activating protein subunit beta [Aphelenchoides besseyi]